MILVCLKSRDSEFEVRLKFQQTINHVSITDGESHEITVNCIFDETQTNRKGVKRLCPGFFTSLRQPYFFSRPDDPFEITMHGSMTLNLSITNLSDEQISEILNHHNFTEKK